jgi:hypothetical protein
MKSQAELSRHFFAWQHGSLSSFQMASRNHGSETFFRLRKSKFCARAEVSPTSPRGVEVKVFKDARTDSRCASSHRCREESASPPSPSVVSGLVNGEKEEEDDDEEDDEDAVARAKAI